MNNLYFKKYHNIKYNTINKQLGGNQDLLKDINSLIKKI